MTAHIQPIPYVEDWADPSPRFLRKGLPPAPHLPLERIFAPQWVKWIRDAAEAKSAPPDYIMAGLLATAGAAIGNTRWVSPWAGWAEPPILWTMLIGAPSSNKSPGLDAVMTPLKELERDMRKKAEADLAEWSERVEVAKIAQSAWKDATKAALKAGEDLPPRPDEANPGQERHLPCLSVTDSTVERLGVILANQPRGTLMARDELAGWLMGMTRYAGGGSDRPFWLEAYGGRGYRVERMGRDPVYIDRLSVGVTGSIQPDRLRSLLMKSDDDGLLARFLPIWPDPAPVMRPRAAPDEGFINRALGRFYDLQLMTDEHDQQRPWVLPFDDGAKDQLDQFRLNVREWENEAEGLMLSYIGKLPGLTARIALILAHLDWAAQARDQPQDIDAQTFSRAADLVEHYALPMARRAYADASASKVERAAMRLVEIIRENTWQRFTSRDVLRLDRAGLGTAAEVNPVLQALEENHLLRSVEVQKNPRGGRPSRAFLVNPAVLNG